MIEEKKYYSEKKINYLLQHIKELQSKGNKIYPAGLFPSIRFHTHLPYQREDDNIFFTALIVFTLQQLKASLSKENQQVINEITGRAVQTYMLYQNKAGLSTYNFWQTKPSRHFPNGYILKRQGFLQLPDDIDDTVFIYLTAQKSPEDVNWLKQKLILHANLYKKQIKNTRSKYMQLKAYSTWFGKHMYIEFDFCVLCNLMYFIYKNKLPLNENDRDTITFLSAVIKSNEHFTHPFQIAPSYPKTSLILYHFSRLIATFHIPELALLKEKAAEDIEKVLGERVHPMEKILLATALMRLGKMPEEINLSQNPEEIFRKFYFFNGGMLTAFENNVCRKLAKYDIFHLKHQCKAYNYALLLEYEILKSR